MQFHFAPIQGNTDAAYRHFHSKLYGGDLVYYTPFIRWEKDGIRQRDLKDLNSELNNDIRLIPQIIFRDKEELVNLIEVLKENGAKEINLNMGCPFPLQTGHHRGAATIANEQLAKDVVETIKNNPEIDFSIKMRLGLNNPDEWRTLLHYLNQVDLKNIILHPRVAKQQYGGEVDMDQFRQFVAESKNPVVYNGDLKTPEDISKIINEYPNLSGIMIGRGALARPSIFSEYISGNDLEKEARLEKLLEFHRTLLDHYSSILCGDSQIISKIKPFWEYSEEEIGRKPWKAIKKAVNIAKYHSGVAMIN